MTLSLKNDRSRAGGGFALLEGGALADVTTITIEDAARPGVFLQEDGKWGKAPFAFPVEATPSGTLSLGPHIVDFVPTDMQVALRAQGGRDLGKVFWADVVPSRNPRSVTSAEVFRQREKAKAAEEAARVAAAQAAAEAAKRRDDEAEAKRREDEADAARMRDEAEAKLRQEERDRLEAEQRAQKGAPTPPKPRRGLFALLGVLLIAALIGGVLWANPALLGRPKAVATVTPPPQPPPEAPPPPVTPPPVTPPPPPVEPPPPPPPPPPSPPPPPVAVDCGNEFSGKLDGLSRLSDAEKVELGERALHAGCGSEAFRAFDASDPQSNEAAAWYLARFYDPNEADPVIRRAAGVHPDFAAAYYRLWRDRSPRQAEALAKICRSSSDAGASLRRSCGH